MQLMKSPQDPLSYLHWLYPYAQLAKATSPSELLVQFHLTILEHIQQNHKEQAYKIYLDLVSRKDELEIKEEECMDILHDIVFSIEELGFPVSKNDLIS